MALINNHSPRQVRPILSRGKNCWIDNASVDACGLLVDGREYYRAFYEAACAAQQYILINGWKFNSDVQLLRGCDIAQAQGERELLPFLKQCCQKNSELHVYVLAWDYSLIYAMEWEWFLAQKFTEAHDRIHFLFDDQHAVGKSNHEKYVVVDGQMGFVGGLDFNNDDWDDRDHLSENPDRVKPDGKPYGPYHDVQAYLLGPAVEELDRYFQRRWEKVSGQPLSLPAPLAPPSIHVSIPIQARQVAFSCTHPENITKIEAPSQIRALYADAIAAAEELIYIENQYFTATAVSEALTQRMRAADRPSLDIVVILPKQLPSFPETATLEPARLRMLDALAAVAKQTGHRLGVYYSAATAKDGSEVVTLIHSKVIIVDDRFLSVGSANTSNRSLELDDELNITWEAIPPEGEILTDSIRQARANLLAEHCGLLHHAEALRDFQRAKGLVDHLDRLAHSQSGRLRPLTREAILQDKAWLDQLERWGLSIDLEGHLVGNSG